MGWYDLPVNVVMLLREFGSIRLYRDTEDGREWFDEARPQPMVWFDVDRVMRADGYGLWYGDVILGTEEITSENIVDCDINNLCIDTKRLDIPSLQHHRCNVNWTQEGF